MSDLVTKKCSRCGEIKPIYDFGLNSKFKDGYSCYCKSCRNEMAKAWYANKKIKQHTSDISNALAAFTPRDLLAELKRRGYKWEKMHSWQEIKYENI